jgi:hypothetical protein
MVVCGESVAGELERGRRGSRKDVWEVSVSGVSSKACSEAAFIGWRGLARRWPKVGVRAAYVVSTADATALGACWRARPRPAVLSRACWCAGQGRGGKGEGSGCFASTFLPGLTAGVRAGRWGVDREESRRELGHCGKDMGTSEVALHCLQT